MRRLCTPIIVLHSHSHLTRDSSSPALQTRPRRSSPFYKALEHSSTQSLGHLSTSASCTHDTGLGMTDLSRRQRPV